MLIENEWPRAHLLMDDFFAPAALATVLRELPTLEGALKPGLVRDVGHDGQSVFFEHERRKNRALWIHDPSKTLSLFREQLWSAPLLASFEQAREPLFQIIPNCWAPHLQVSSYMTGDHYAFHEDEGAGVNLTAIVFIAAEPKMVRGGDLVLAYDGDETTIPFRNNRLVIFPSKTLHRVTPVRVASTDPRHARISLQCWLTYGHAAEPDLKAQRGAKKKRARTPEADRPTFLLAEEPILAAAQALGGAAASDQTPEDLYWGAFYLSRILSANLRALAAAQPGLDLGPVLVRRAEELEVHARGRYAGAAIRVGFALRGPEIAPAKALSLFVEVGRGKARTLTRALLPAGSEEQASAATLRRLLTRATR